ncbi:unnamed protein product [Meloidogyne enterolobii]|uniref:Uncharacterized protein n=1 Tax=Meloidogyne enterolobii TaxID=390850 RepID=A0ACB0ZCK9_MELEN
MNCGIRLFALFFLLVVNLSSFTEVDSAIGPPWTWPTHPYRQGRSVPFQDMRARRHATSIAINKNSRTLAKIISDLNS